MAGDSTIKNSSSVGLKGGKGDDSGAAHAAYADARATKDAMEQPMSTMQGDGSGYGGDPRPGVPIQTHYNSTAVDSLQAKLDLAEKHKGVTQAMITDADVAAHRQIRENDYYNRKMRYAAQLYPVDTPGGLEQLKKVSPELPGKMEEGIKNKYSWLEKLERAKRLAPQTPEDLDFKYLVDNGLVPAHITDAFDAMMGEHGGGQQNPSLSSRWNNALTDHFGNIFAFAWNVNKLDDRNKVAMTNASQPLNPFGLTRTGLGVGGGGALQPGERF